jgi:hypothetical protein
VRTGIDNEIRSFIEKNLIPGESSDPALYEAAIDYYIWHKLDRKQTLAFIEKGISLKNHRIWYYWKVQELMKDKKYQEAMEAAQTAIDLIRNSPEEPGYNKTELIRDFENYITEIKAR